MRRGDSWRFRTATVVLLEHELVSTFADGRENRFYLPDKEGQGWYRDIVRWAGYGEDCLGYAVEHDLTHHWLADRLGWDHSWALHDGDVNVPLDRAANHFQWEEHLANNLQRMLRGGAPDEHGVVQAVFHRCVLEVLTLLDRALEPGYVHRP